MASSDMEISSSDEEERILVNESSPPVAQVITPGQVNRALMRSGHHFERPQLPFAAERVVIDLGSESDEANTPAALRYGPFPQGYVSPRPQPRPARATTPLMQEHELKIARLKRDIALREKKAAEQALRMRRENSSSPLSSANAASPTTQLNVAATIAKATATVVDSAPDSITSAVLESASSTNTAAPLMPLTPTPTPSSQSVRATPAQPNLQDKRGAKRPASPPPSEHERGDFEKTLRAIQHEINKNKKALAAASNNANRPLVSSFGELSFREGNSSSTSHHTQRRPSLPSAPQTSAPTATETVVIDDDDTSMDSDTSSVSPDSPSDDEYMTAPESPDPEETRLRQELIELHARREGIDKLAGWTRRKKTHFETAALGVKAKLSLCVPPAKKQKLVSSTTSGASRPQLRSSSGSISAPTTPSQDEPPRPKKEELRSARPALATPPPSSPAPFRPALRNPQRPSPLPSAPPMPRAVRPPPPPPPAPPVAISPVRPLPPRSAIPVAAPRPAPAVSTRPPVTSKQPRTESAWSRPAPEPQPAAPAPPRRKPNAQARPAPTPASRPARRERVASPPIPFGGVPDQLLGDDDFGSFLGRLEEFLRFRLPATDTVVAFPKNRPEMCVQRLMTVEDVTLVMNDVLLTPVIDKSQEEQKTAKFESVLYHVQRQPENLEAPMSRIIQKINRALPAEADFASGMASGAVQGLQETQNIVKEEIEAAGRQSTNELLPAVFSELQMHLNKEGLFASLQYNKYSADAHWFVVRADVGRIPAAEDYVKSVLSYAMRDSQIDRIKASNLALELFLRMMRFEGLGPTMRLLTDDSQLVSFNAVAPFNIDQFSSRVYLTYQDTYTLWMSILFHQLSSQTPDTLSLEWFDILVTHGRAPRPSERKLITIDWETVTLEPHEQLFAVNVLVSMLKHFYRATRAAHEGEAVRPLLVATWRTFVNLLQHLPCYRASGTLALIRPCLRMPDMPTETADLVLQLETRMNSGEVEASIQRLYAPMRLSYQLYLAYRSAHVLQLGPGSNYMDAARRVTQPLSLLYDIHLRGFETVEEVWHLSLHSLGLFQSDSLDALRAGKAVNHQVYLTCAFAWINTLFLTQLRLWEEARLDRPHIVQTLTGQVHMICREARNHVTSNEGRRLVTHYATSLPSMS
ncbi:hypothetical protein BCR43DRAFT_526319 [Syncephalastrum racemosum]|uniref:Uncharacterized protein n=1 Tax=Syncephalastrum racemosum TaxID=13706 RepID=A0A1X2H617_SYNRA|nr:hypothetical protein BCR43DRAFT_526319 [Syncephalastrum racemosum]